METTADSLMARLPSLPPSRPEGQDETRGAEDGVVSLVRRLPEIYQPIYGHPEIHAARSADDHRIDVLRRVVEQISSHFDRSLRILDLGSAQGYTAFRLAELGHGVTGIDVVPTNVALARAIQERLTDLNVEFLEGDIAECPTLVDLDGYDLVVAFSVLQHIAHRGGHDAAVELVAVLSQKISHAVFEMALAAEPVYWAESLPEDPRVTLAPYAFIREVGRVGTHLSEVRRPILFASQSHVLAAGNLHEIESWTEEPHTEERGALRSLRRYRFLPSGVEKIAARFADEADEDLLSQLRQELRREAHVLQALTGAGMEAPEVIEFVDGADESIIVRSSYPGVLLSEIVDSLDEDARSVITGQVLETLAELEAHGLYHADLRLWNVVWDPHKETAHLVDHGAISPVPEDMKWPNDAYYSFLVWLVSLWGFFPDQTGFQIPRAGGIDRAELSPRIASLISALMTHPRDGSVFRDLSARWAQPSTESAPTAWPATPVAWAWLSAIEQHGQRTRAALASECTAVSSERDRVIAERDALIAERAALGSECDDLRSTRRAMASEREILTSDCVRLRSACDRLRSEREAVESRREATEAELSRVLGTWSWRLT